MHEGFNCCLCDTTGLSFLDTEEHLAAHLDLAVYTCVRCEKGFFSAIKANCHAVQCFKENPFSARLITSNVVSMSGDRLTELERLINCCISGTPHGTNRECSFGNESIYGRLADLTLIEGPLAESSRTEEKPLISKLSRETVKGNDSLDVISRLVRDQRRSVPISALSNEHGETVKGNDSLDVISRLVRDQRRSVPLSALSNEYGRKADKYMRQKLATIKSEPEYDKEESHTCKKKVEDVMPKNIAATTAKNAGETTDTVVSDNHGQENNMVRIESPDMRLVETSALSADETRIFCLRAGPKKAIKKKHSMKSGKKSDKKSDKRK